jgi:hypothetical protein
MTFEVLFVGVEFPLEWKDDVVGTFLLEVSF